MDATLKRAGGLEDPRVDIELLQFIFTNFPEIIENLVNRTDFPIEEGNANNLWNHLAEYCFRASRAIPLDTGFFYLRTAAYTEWYKAMLRYEEGKNTRTIHKGMPLHQLGIFCLESGNKVLAKKYLQLAHIEDIQEFLLKNRPSYIGQAYRLLRSGLLVSQKELDSLKKTTEANSSEKYPEKVLMEFLLDRTNNKNRVTEDSILALNTNYTRDLLKDAKDVQSSSKGNTFTRLISYLFSTVAGFEVIGENMTTKAGEHDYDILIRNLVTEDPVFEEFGKYIVAECKFVADQKSGIDILTKLLYKIKYHDCKCGVLFSRKGVSFGEDFNLTIKKAFNRDSVIILNVEESAIEEVINGEKTFLGVLLTAYERVRFEI